MAKIKRKEALEAAKHVEEDFSQLLSGRWNPCGEGRESAQDSLENARIIIQYLKQKNHG